METTGRGDPQELGAVLLRAPSPAPEGPHTDSAGEGQLSAGREVVLLEASGRCHRLIWIRGPVSTLGCAPPEGSATTGSVHRAPSC